MNFQDTNTAVSDEAGNLLFYYNGVYINNAAHEVMAGGEAINDCGGFDCELGYDMFQGGLVLPDPGNPNRYYLFFGENGFYYIPQLQLVNTGLYYAVIDMEEADGLGAVVAKDTVMTDTLEYGHLSAVRHANGRDWWLFNKEEDTDHFYTTLLDPTGPHVIREFYSQDTIRSGVGQSAFSPDGRYYAKINLINAYEYFHLDLFEVDRCAGTLSNQLRDEMGDGEYLFMSGLAFSPNSRFLYLTRYEHIFQYDLWADDIMASRDTVAIYEGPITNFSSRFSLAQLAPDGKIYITTTSGIPAMHVIHRPDEKGAACAVEQHLPIPTHSTTLPNFPYYRLGPIDGSPCDTLGIDNVPLANFRWAPQPDDSLQVQFTDLSAYDPETWKWQFGDGSSSTERCPVHTYAEEGYYLTCLLVTNEKGTHQRCRQLNLGVPVGTEAPTQSASGVEVYPNPTTGAVHIQLDRALPVEVSFDLFDGLGRSVHRRLLPAHRDRFDLQLPMLPSGLYHYRIGSESRLVGQGQLILR